MAEDPKMILMDVAGLTLDPVSNAPVVVLKEREGNRIVPIWIGIMEAQAIVQVIEKIAVPRPLTHDLMHNILKEMDVKIEGVEINDLKDNTFYAVILAKFENKVHRIDSRPSDAIALALRTQAKIAVAEFVVEQAKAEIVGDAKDLLSLSEKGGGKDKWTKILESLSEEAFGKYKQ
ncbi:MAG: bifunctional nuclease family protein [Myxococcota bacterium]